ncbi:unnamed protein product [Rangifer tarandus platyrhynchus]|uniref:Uncharacterized protein n=1 Tax=Rangifer tarandus platyrhynchus TaxID=3082113 RepID=A0ABN8XNM8_RANTA|nr:unnamed protein product [Rangifer tarandus platyrhynchus]
MTCFGALLAATASADIPYEQCAGPTREEACQRTRSSACAAREEGDLKTKNHSPPIVKYVLAQDAARLLYLVAAADPSVVCDGWLHTATYGDEEAYCNVCRRLLHVMSKTATCHR